MSDAESTVESESLNQPKQQEDQKPRSIPSLALWPPTQRTRDAVVTRLIETLSTPSPLSKLYVILSADDAADVVRLIEEDAFAAAATEEDGIQILQVYSKEISKRMLDTVKNRNAAAAGAGRSTRQDGSIRVGDMLQISAMRRWRMMMAVARCGLRGRNVDLWRIWRLRRPWE